jgi:hypothetical protein
MTILVRFRLKNISSSWYLSSRWYFEILAFFLFKSFILFVIIRNDSVSSQFPLKKKEKNGKRPRVNRLQQIMSGLAAGHRIGNKTYSAHITIYRVGWVPPVAPYTHISVYCVFSFGFIKVTLVDLDCSRCSITLAVQ